MTYDNYIGVYKSPRSGHRRRQMCLPISSRVSNDRLWEHSHSVSWALSRSETIISKKAKFLLKEKCIFRIYRHDNRLSSQFLLFSNKLIWTTKSHQLSPFFLFLKAFLTLNQRCPPDLISNSHQIRVGLRGNCWNISNFTDKVNIDPWTRSIM